MQGPLKFLDDVLHCLFVPGGDCWLANWTPPLFAARLDAVEATAFGAHQREFEAAFFKLACQFGGAFRIKAVDQILTSHCGEEIRLAVWPLAFYFDGVEIRHSIEM